jgi:predicted  nucleic acid-binding Zn-ribbon protein
MTSQYATLDGCPNCGTDDFRAVAPLSPAVEVYACERCFYRWEVGDD